LRASTDRVIALLAPRPLSARVIQTASHERRRRRQAEVPAVRRYGVQGLLRRLLWACTRRVRRRGSGWLHRGDARDPAEPFVCLRSVPDRAWQRSEDRLRAARVRKATRPRACQRNANTPDTDERGRALCRVASGLSVRTPGARRSGCKRWPVPAPRPFLL